MSNYKKRETMKEINYLITKGNIGSQLKYSLLKLLDWRIGNAVCVTRNAKGKIFIADCRQSLQIELLDKVGGCCEASMWCGDIDTDLYNVLKIVTEWVNNN